MRRLLSLPRDVILSLPRAGAEIGRHRYLLWQMTLRDVAARYRGSFMGLFWSLITPILTLAVYTYIFGFVFKARWPIGDGANQFEFALILFSGLIVHMLVTDCVTRAPGLIVGNPNLVKKVVFPLEILPVSAVGSALFHTLVNVVVLLLFQLAVYHTLPWTVVLVPVVVAPVLLYAAGLTWFLSSLGVFLRDIGQAVGVISTVLLFTAPIFYPLSATPEALQPVLFLNPLTVPVEALRNVTLLGQMPDWIVLAKYTLGGLAVSALGHAWFSRTRNAFADVL